jgi:hypothetical protein
MIATDDREIARQLREIEISRTRRHMALNRLMAFGMSGGAPSPTLGLPNPMLGTVERQPQTTAAPGAAGPFTRHSRKARLRAFEVTGQAYGALITQSLKAVGGHLRKLDLRVQASGGTGTTTNATAAADAPYNAISSLIFRDAFGEPIVQCDGFGLRLINMYGGQVAQWDAADPANLPSFSALATTGNFTVRMAIPIEALSDAYCSLPSMNAAAQPTLEINLAAAASVYTTSPSPTVPTVAVAVEENYWAAPLDDPSLGPPDVGSSAQWSQAVAAQSIGSASNTNVTLPRVGTWIHTLILVLRDSTNARVDNWPNTIDFWVDGTPYYSEPEAVREDLMFQQFGQTQPTGVLVYSFRDSLHAMVSEADTADEWLHTTPGTLLEVRGTWDTISNAPATLTCYTGEVYPLGGRPHTHLHV